MEKETDLSRTAWLWVYYINLTMPSSFTSLSHSSSFYFTYQFNMYYAQVDDDYISVTAGLFWFIMHGFMSMYPGTGLASNIRKQALCGTHQLLFFAITMIICDMWLQLFCFSFMLNFFAIIYYFHLLLSLAAIIFLYNFNNME